jgi:hypothetical protein
MVIPTFYKVTLLQVLGYKDFFPAQFMVYRGQGLPDTGTMDTFTIINFE